MVVKISTREEVVLLAREILEITMAEEGIEDSKDYKELLLKDESGKYIIKLENAVGLLFSANIQTAILPKDSYPDKDMYKAIVVCLDAEDAKGACLMSSKKSLEEFYGLPYGFFLPREQPYDLRELKMLPLMNSPAA